MSKTRNRTSLPQSPSAMQYREGCQLRTSTLDVEGRSIEATYTTENAVPMWDWERWERVPEVLRMDGAQWSSRGQVPFLNAHNRNSVDDQLGSGRSIRIDGGEMVGRLHFDSESTRQFNKVREGHLTDVSVGYEVLDKTYVPKGETQIVSGRSYEGPVNVVTKWRLREISLVPIGADEQAKLRGFDPGRLPPKKKEIFQMNATLRETCVALGMDRELSDEESQTWMEARLKNEDAAEGKQKKDPPASTAGAGGAITEARILSMLESATEKVLAGREAKALAHRADVDAMIELAGIDKRIATEAYALPKDKARELVMATKAKGQTDVMFLPIEGGASGKEKHVGALRTALVMRAMESSGYQRREGRPDHREVVLPLDQRDKNGQQFRNHSLLNIAEECLRADGYSEREVRGLSRENLAIAAMGWPEKAGLRAADSAYHTTGSFVLLTTDAVNKSMTLGYAEFPATWNGPMRQAASVPDFKQIRRLRLGAVGNLPVWPDNTDPERASFSEARESYAVECRSLEIGFSYRLLINDDLDALSRTPFQLGQSASRTVNAVAWAEVTANANMSDSQALFLETAAGNRFRSNLTTGAATPTVATLQTMTNKMMQMRGENAVGSGSTQVEGPDILALQPRYIIGPSALSTSIKQLVLSAYDPAASQFMTYNTATELMPVIEPLLDANSTTAWYLFASPGQIDTVEVTFLQGQESPVTRDWVDERTLAHNWTVLQTFAAKAMNHRGMQRHNGA